MLYLSRVRPPLATVALISTRLSQVAIKKLHEEITASTAAAVIKFIEASADLTRGSEDLSEKDVHDRHQTMMAKLTLPTSHDEHDEFSST